MRIGKSGPQIATENAAILRSYLEANRDTLPVLADGMLNKSAIARAAGLDRQIFTTNPAAKALLSEFGTVAAQTRAAPMAGPLGDLLRQKDAEISRLRDLVAKREVELSALRAEARTARQLKAIHDTMIETMRHVKPLPQPPENHG